MRQKWKWLVLFTLLMGMTACSSAAELQVRFWNAGKADACLLKTENSTVLIDTGKDKFGNQLTAYLEENGISEIDVMIITHFDKDHVGGADKVLESVKVHQIYEPDYWSDSKQYTQYREAAQKAGAQVTTLAQNTSFALDGVTYVIDVANQKDYGEEEENDFSLVIAAYYGDTSFLFAGDAENPRLGELLGEGLAPFSVLKVPHHGKEEKLSARFFDAIRPAHAVITSDDEEPEEDNVVYMLRQYGQVYLTRLGDVVCTTDGKSISVVQK